MQAVIELSKFSYAKGSTLLPNLPNHSDSDHSMGVVSHYHAVNGTWNMKLTLKSADPARISPATLTLSV